MAVIAVGLDVVEVARARELHSRHGERIFQRLLTEEEREYVRSLGDPMPAFAARLAAKEATYKALQACGDARAVGWREIGVLRRADGRPEVALNGRAAEVVGAGTVIHLSLTHSHGIAAAVVILER